MKSDKKRRLAQIRWLIISMAVAITTLSFEYIWTKFALFLYTAMALGVFGLTLISLIVSRVVTAKPHFSRHKPRRLSRAS